MPASPIEPALPRSRSREIAFWLLALLLVAYVALCAGNRDVIANADAWEHLRSIEALSLDWHAGNPTLATPEPSVRYSPWIAVQAAIVRATHADAYRVLSIAATLNTLLLCVALRVLLAAWGAGRSAPTALVLMVGLWGVAPAYAGTTALADLPWHMVNPSAWAFALVLFAVALVRHWVTHASIRFWPWLAAWPLVAVAMLDHGMTGAFGLLAILIVAIERRRGALFAIALGVAVLAACALWPLYPFVRVLRAHHDVGYWLNVGVMRLMLLEWCAPAVVLSLVTLAAFDVPIVRTFARVGWAALAVTLLALPLKNPALARFLMPGTFFLHVAIAVWATRERLDTLAGWRETLAAIWHRGDALPAATLRAFVGIALLYGLAPQLIAVVKEPQLARPIFARLKPVRDQQRHLRPIYAELLAGVPAHDVVLADAETAWPIPATHGRVVAALHYERLPTDQPRREADVETYFDPATTSAERDAIAAKYGARWILVDRARTPAVVDAIAATHRSVRRVGSLELFAAE